jgi:hypothetical protein
MSTNNFFVYIPGDNTWPYRSFVELFGNREQPHMHHDALELPDGQMLLLTFLCEGQEATVLQLPAKPTTQDEAQAQERVAVAG